MKRTSITFVRSSATFSPDGLYRYTLCRVWDESLPIVGWCACNPSTDAADEPDPTNWRIVDFSVRFGFGGYRLVSVYAFRSTDPKALWTVKDPVGPDNDEHILATFEQTNGMIVCWGTNPKRERVYEVSKILRESLGSLWCLRMTKGKLPQPEHPLYLPGSLTRQKWT